MVKYSETSINEYGIFVWGGVNLDFLDYVSWHLSEVALGINNHLKKNIWTYLEKRPHPTYLRFLE